MKRIRKAVLPVAGLGTRFLPATKSVPKEMLTVVDRPVIQHVVDEAKEAGIEHIVFVTGRNKAVIEDHFDIAYELDRTLAERGKTKELEALKADLPAAGQTSFTRQQAPLGLGHAVWCDQTHQYGIVGVGESFGQAFRITSMVEKPPRGTAPSNFIISGRYILQPEVFGILSGQEKGAGGEIQLTDAMKRLSDSQDFFGMRYSGRTYDTGNKLGFLMANVAYALEREELSAPFRAELEQILRKG